MQLLGYLRSIIKYRRHCGLLLNCKERFVSCTGCTCVEYEESVRCACESVVKGITLFLIINLYSYLIYHIIKLM